MIFKIMNNAENCLDAKTGSILIAEFLGSKFINDAPEDYPNGYYYQPEGVECDCPTGKPDEWCFNTSWDWLMPVVEKIEIEYRHYVNICGYHKWENPFVCIISDNRDEEVAHQSSDSKIKCVFDAVVDFIEHKNLRAKAGLPL